MMKKKQILAVTLCAGMAACNSMPVYADEPENPSVPEVHGSVISVDGISEGQNTFRISVPKNLTLDADGKADYEVSVNGELSFMDTITVNPTDTLALEDGVNFLLNNTSDPDTDGVIVDVFQDDTEFTFMDVAHGKEVSGSLQARSELTPGSWSNGEDGFGFDIRIENNSLGQVVYTDFTVTADNLYMMGITNEGDVVIPGYFEYDGVHYKTTKIGDGAFQVSSAMTSVYIPDTVEEIGNYAFVMSDLSGGVRIPSSCKKIGYDAFANCKFSSVVIPEGVEEIGIRAFMDCTLLEQVSLPSTLTCISEMLFHGCTSMKTAYIHDGATSIDKAAFMNCSNLGSVYVPSSVKVIGEHAFAHCRNLEQIELDEGLEEIHEFAFTDCRNLNHIIFPESLLLIKGNAFEQVPLKEVTIPAATNVKTNAFIHCYQLENVIINSNSVEAYAFNGAYITNLIYGEGVTNIPDRMHIGDNYLQTITFPSTLRNIGNIAFYGNGGLQQVILPDGLETIGEAAFGGCGSIGCLRVPESVTSIGADAFKNINNVIYAGSAEDTGWGQESLNGVMDGDYVYTDDTKTVIASYIGTDTDVVIPDGITAIEPYAFKAHTELTSVQIPASVVSIGAQAFNSCTSLTDVSMEEGVSSIGVGAFGGCTSLRSIALPDSVTTVGEKLFADDTSLEEVSLGTLTQIPAYTFQGCSALAGFDTAGYTNIGNYAFAYSGIVSADVSNANLGINVFDSCASLRDVNLTGITAIPEDAFTGCVALENVILDTNLTDIGNGAFSGCVSLDGVGITGSGYSIELPNTLTNIGAEAFAQCTGIRYAELPESVTEIRSGCFKDCTGLEKARISPAVESIQGSAFKGCSSLIELELNEGLSYIGTYAFYDCDSLKSLKLNDGLYYIGAYAFVDCDSLETIVIPDSVYYIDQGAFNSCTSLTDVYFMQDHRFSGNEIFYKTRGEVTTFHFKNADADACLKASVKGYNPEYGVKSNDFNWEVNE